MIVLLVLICLPAWAQKETLHAGAQLELELSKSLSSEDATPGTVVDFLVRTKVVSFNGFALIQEGVYGQGRITKVIRADESRTGEGILEIEAVSVRAVDGTRVRIQSGRLFARGNCTRGPNNCEASLNVGTSLSATVQEDYIITMPK